MDELEQSVDRSCASVSFQIPLEDYQKLVNELYKLRLNISQQKTQNDSL